MSDQPRHRRRLTQLEASRAIQYLRDYYEADTIPGKLALTLEERKGPGMPFVIDLTDLEAMALRKALNAY